MSLSAWEAFSLNASMPKTLERDLSEAPSSELGDHELRWAIRDGIAQMYRHLGLDELSSQACHHLGVEPLHEEM